MADSVTPTPPTEPNRARNIVIGAAIVIVLTYWQFTGSLPLLASSVIPEPSGNSGQLRSVYTYGTEILADLLYFIGVAATAIGSGIWGLAIQLIRWVIDTINKRNTPTPPSTTPNTPSFAFVADKLDERTSYIFGEIQPHLQKFEERLKDLEAHLEDLRTPSPVAVAAPRPSRARKPS